MVPGLVSRSLLFFDWIKNFIFWYKSPGNLSYLWNFGFLALLCLVSQILSGIFLAMHYVSDVNLAFLSIEYINRDVYYGWLIRYIHSNGASMFFIVVYLHMFRGLYYSSFAHPRQLVWITGVIIWLLMILTAFLGYVLPWGQMSYWAATVIIKLMSSIPVIGIDIVYWLWGGFSVNQATLNRFFSFHYLLPFIILALSIVHMLFLHEFGSNNPLGITALLDDLFLHPHFVVKDSFGLNIFLLLMCTFVFFYPNMLGHPDNYILANPLVTPPHIVPEWYLLPFYAILRSIPNKLLGVVFMVFSILGFILLPFILGFSKVRSFSFKPLHKMYFFIFVSNCFLLGCIGGLPVVSPYYELGQFLTILYFMIFIILPLLAFIESTVYYIRDSVKGTSYVKL